MVWQRTEIYAKQLNTQRSFKDHFGGDQKKYRLKSKKKKECCYQIVIKEDEIYDRNRIICHDTIFR